MWTNGDPHQCITVFNFNNEHVFRSWCCWPRAPGLGLRETEREDSMGAVGAANLATNPHQQAGWQVSDTEHV